MGYGFFFLSEGKLNAGVAYIQLGDALGGHLAVSAVEALKRGQAGERGLDHRLGVGDVEAVVAEAERPEVGALREGDQKVPDPVVAQLVARDVQVVHAPDALGEDVGAAEVDAVVDKDQREDAAVDRKS